MFILSYDVGLNASPFILLQTTCILSATLSRVPSSLWKGENKWGRTGRDKKHQELCWPELPFTSASKLKSHTHHRESGSRSNYRTMMVVWHLWLNGHEFEQALGVGDGQGNGVLQSMGSQRVRHDWATELNWSHSEGSGIYFQTSGDLISIWLPLPLPSVPEG